MQGEAKRKAEDKLQAEVEARRMRSTEGGDELPIPGASSSAAPNADGEVSRRSSVPSTQLKCAHDNEPAQEDQPPNHRARREILCSLVHGNLDQQPGRESFRISGAEKGSGTSSFGGR